MGKRGTADSGVHPSEENQKHDKKRNRTSPSESDVGKEGEIMIGTTLKATNAERREHAMSSIHDSDPIREEDEFATLSGAMGDVLERTNKVCANLDGNLYVGGEIISKMDDNNKENGFMRKYSKRKKGNNSCEQAPSKRLHDVRSLFKMEIPSSSAPRNLEINSKGDCLNETRNSDKLMISVKQEDFIPKAADGYPEEMAGKIDSSLLENKSSSSVKTKYYKRKRKAKSISGSHSSDSCPSLADAMVLDTSGNNNSEVSVSDNMKLPGEMAGGQSNNLQSGSKKSCMVSDINKSYEGKNIKPRASKNIIWREKIYSNSGSCRKIPVGPSVRALQCSPAKRTPASKVADPDAENQSNNEASARRDQINLLEEECFSKSADVGIAEKVEKASEVDMKPNDAKRTKSRRRNRHRGCGKGTVSNLNAVVSPALPSNYGISASKSTLCGSTDLDSSGGNNITESTRDDLVSVEECSCTIREGGLVVSNSSEVLPKLASKINTADLSLKTKQNKEADDHDSLEIDSSYYPAISSSRSETLEMDEMLERDKVDSSFGNSLKSNVLSEDSCLIGGPNDTSQVGSSIHLKKDSSSCLDALYSKEAKKRENGKCLDGMIEQIPGHKLGHQLDCTGLAQADCSNIAILSEVRSGEKEMEHAIQDLGKFTGACLQKGAESFHVINNSPDVDSGSVKQRLEVIPTDCKDKASLPPSPIRGVVDDFTSSSDLTNKQNGLLDLLSGEEGSFSFQIVSNAIKEKSHGSRLRESSESTNKIASQNVKPGIHENSPSTSSSLCDSGVIVCLEKKVGSSPGDHLVEDVSPDVLENQDKNLEEMTSSPQRAVISSNRKKLLVLDLNGLLADITMDTHRAYRAHRRVGGKSLFKRPYCDDFLKFCFEKFNIGVWSSRKSMYNVDIVVECLMRDTKDKLLFCWDQSKCTTTGFGTIGNVHKPLLLKELKKLWDKEEPELPFEFGEYTPSNTLLIDDSPYKALLNPPYTGIFPPPYNLRDVRDNSLGPGGDLRVYLEGLAVTGDVQHYVREHPFGQAAITDKHPDWSFYLQIIDKTSEPSGLS